MTAKFTPGPWVVGQAPTSKALCIQTADNNGAWICGQLHNQPCEMRLGEAEANAHLIAAAPELYEALEAVELAWHTDASEDWSRATKLSDAARRKARGETA